MIKIESYAVMTKMKKSADKNDSWKLCGEDEGIRYFKTRDEAKNYLNECKENCTDSNRMFKVCSLSRI